MFKYFFSGLLLLVLLQSAGALFYTLTVDAVNGVDDETTCHAIDEDGVVVNSTIPCKSIGFAISPLQTDDILELAVMAGSYTGTSNTNLQLSSTSVTITGYPDAQGNLPTIDCELSSTSFTITPRDTAIINYIKWRRCTSAKGGALNVVATTGTSNRLELYYCIFENNTATGTGGGGAIYSESAVLIVHGSTFLLNSASTTGGGAISMRNNQLSLLSCTFSNNSAIQGGAIYGYNLASSQLTSCNFSNNQATVQGGAFFAEGINSHQEYSFAGSNLDNNCAVNPYTDSTDVQERCTPSNFCNITATGTVSGCLGVYQPPPVSNSTDNGKKISNKDRAIIIGVVVPFGVIFIVSIALYLFLRKKTDAEMEKREAYRKQILKALDKMSPEEQEAARLEAERADPSAPKCQLCMIRPINNPLPCGHAVVCSVCRTILLECPIKGCKKATR